MFELASFPFLQKATSNDLKSLQSLGSFGEVVNSDSFLKKVQKNRGLYLIGRGSFRVINGKGQFLFVVEHDDLYGEFELFGSPSENLKLNLLSPIHYFFLPESNLSEVFKSFPELKERASTAYKERLLWVKKPPEETQEALNFQKADIIYVLGPKGGCGKTLTAVNLGAYLSKFLEKKVLCLDLSLELGNVREFLFHNSDGEKNILTLAHQSGWNKESVIRKFIEKDSKSGLECLFSPNTLNVSDRLSIDTVKTLIKILQPHYDFIIIDTNSFLSSFDQELLKSATDILMVMDLEYPSISNSIKIFDFLSKVDFYKKNLKILLNRSDRSFQIQKEKIQHPIQNYISFFLPSDGKNCVTSLNEGVPLVIKVPHSEIAEGFGLLARDYAHIEKQSKKGMFSKILDALHLG